MTAHRNLRGGEMVQVAWACVVLGAGSGFRRVPVARGGQAVWEREGGG